MGVRGRVGKAHMAVTKILHPLRTGARANTTRPGHSQRTSGSQTAAAIHSEDPGEAVTKHSARERQPVKTSNTSNSGQTGIRAPPIGPTILCGVRTARMDVDVPGSGRPIRE